MTYTALSSRGPRIALAVSADLFRWERLGLATFQPYEGVDFNDVANNDALFFPVAISDPDGQPAWRSSIVRSSLAPGRTQHFTAGFLAWWISFGRASGYPIT